MIQHYLQKNHHINLKVNKNVSGVLTSVQQMHMNANTTREKNRYLSIVAPHFPAMFLKSIGYKFCSSSFSNARKKKINEKRHFVPPSKAPISIGKKSKINDFLLENSTVASNKTKKIKLSDYLIFFQGNELYFKNKYII